MKKRFAFRVSYSGEREKLERFAKELVKAGYFIDKDPDFSMWRSGKTTIITYYEGKAGYFSHDGSPEITFKYAEHQFAEALAAATKPAE